MLILAEDEDDECETGFDYMPMRGVDGEQHNRRPNVKYDFLETANFPAYRKDKAVMEADGRLLVMHTETSANHSYRHAEETEQDYSY